MFGGRGRDRTGDPLLAKQVLSQLSYTPTVAVTFILKHFRLFQNRIPSRLLARHSAQSFVKRDYRNIDIFFAFGDGILGLQLRPFGIEQLEKIDNTFAIAQAGDIRGALALASLIVQFDEPCLLSMVIRQRTFRFFQRAELGFFLGGHGLFGRSA